MQLPKALAERRPLLVVAHPGHELRVFGWLEQTRPQVCVLTDGAGHGDVGRLPSTLGVLRACGATAGPVLARFTDRQAYALILERRAAEVVALVEELAQALIDLDVDYLAADACEGFNAVHDLCRLTVDAAVTLARRRRGGRPIDSLEFPLEGGPSWRGEGEELSWELDEETLERKLSAARAYPELASEVERALAVHGPAAFRTERMFRVEPLRSLSGRFERPQYERFGSDRVAAGHYARVLRYQEHFVPLMQDVLGSLRLA